MQADSLPGSESTSGPVFKGCRLYDSIYLILLPRQTLGTALPLAEGRGPGGGMEFVAVMVFWVLMVVAAIQLSTSVKTHMKVRTKQSELYYLSCTP